MPLLKYRDECLERFNMIFDLFVEMRELQFALHALERIFSESQKARAQKLLFATPRIWFSRPEGFQKAGNGKQETTLCIVKAKFSLAVKSWQPHRRHIVLKYISSTDSHSIFFFRFFNPGQPSPSPLRDLWIGTRYLSWKDKTWLLNHRATASHTHAKLLYRPSTHSSCLRYAAWNRMRGAS